VRCARVGRYARTAADLSPLGVLIWTRLDATVRYNAVGSWSLTMPATEANWRLTRVPNVGVVVDWNDRSIATRGPIGVQAVQRGRELVFDYYLPRDLTGQAWFSPELGNLTQADLSDTAATTTNALVAGSGQGSTRAFVEVTGPDTGGPWRRVETFVDQRSTSDWVSCLRPARTPSPKSPPPPACRSPH
jgi:hypothetical protein